MPASRRDFGHAENHRGHQHNSLSGQYSEVHAWLDADVARSRSLAQRAQRGTQEQALGHCGGMTIRSMPTTTRAFLSI